MKSEEQHRGTRHRLLLHACCGPCSTIPLSRLMPRFSVSVYFYNPNIFPDGELVRRQEELLWFSRQMGIEGIVGSQDRTAFDAAVAGKEDLGERSDRCRACYSFRLAETARECCRRDIPFFTTTLTVSPLKRADWIIAEGERIAAASGITFVAENFRKRNGFADGVAISRRFGMYRQDYCGCRYSFSERQHRRVRNSHCSAPDREMVRPS